MGTTMTDAILKAGIKPMPLIQRVWLYLVDHPETTAKTLNSVFKHTCLSTVHTLRRRGMVSLVKRPRPFKSRGPQYVNIYTAQNAHKPYELLPLPLLTKVEKKLPVLVPNNFLLDMVERMHAEPSVAEVSATPIVAPVKFDINTLSLKEARALYDELKEIFA